MASGSAQQFAVLKFLFFNDPLSALQDSGFMARRSYGFRGFRVFVLRLIGFSTKGFSGIMFYIGLNT